MTENESIDVSVEAVIDAVADDAERAPDDIRRALDPFTDDGVLTPAAIDATISDVSKILATAETRVDLAALAHEDAKAAADLQRWAVRENDSLSEELASPGWRDRFDDDLEEVRKEIARFDPPVVWDRVQAALADTRYAASIGDEPPASEGGSNDRIGGVF